VAYVLASCESCPCLGTFSSPRTALGQIYLLCYLFCHFAMISTFLLLCLTGFETFGWELWTLIGSENTKVFSGEMSKTRSPQQEVSFKN